MELYEPGELLLKDQVLSRHFTSDGPCLSAWTSPRLCRERRLLVSSWPLWCGPEGAVLGGIGVVLAFPGLGGIPAVLAW